VEFLQGEARDVNREAIETSIRPIVAGLILLITLIGLLGTAIRDPRPHDIPVGISAPPPLVQQLTQGFATQAPGAFAFTTYASEAEARAAVDRREVVASLIVAQAGPRLVLAGGAGDAVGSGVTAAFTNAFRAQGAAGGTELAVEVVHPFPAGDPHGIVLFFVVLATLLSSVAAGALTVLPARDRSWVTQLGIVVTYAISAGIFAGLAMSWLVGGLGDALWLVMAFAALLSLAVGGAIAACARILGAAGVAIAALVVVLLGLISSGGPLGSEFLPDFYRAVAPWLPVAPAYSALRGAVAFDGAGVAVPAILLATWAIVSAVLLAAHGMVRPIQRQTAVAHA
jgi:hypothetical protein